MLLKNMTVIRLSKGSNAAYLAPVGRVNLVPMSGIIG